jgi:hypothetical protein
VAKRRHNRLVPPAFFLHHFPSKVIEASATLERDITGSALCGASPPDFDLCFFL